jgi:hypothetical protein
LDEFVVPFVPIDSQSIAIVAFALISGANQVILECTTTTHHFKKQETAATNETNQIPLGEQTRGNVLANVLFWNTPPSTDGSLKYADRFSLSS